MDATIALKAFVTQHSPQEAYELVLEKVGATYPQRDPVDTRIINEVRTGVATYEGVYKTVKRVADASKISGIIDTQKTVGGWPELKSEPAPLDSDHDGMPDEWELRYGLNPNDASDGSKKYDDGYKMEDGGEKVTATPSLYPSAKP